MIYIKKTTRDKAPIMNNLLPSNGLSGCDTVATMYNIENGAILNVLDKGKCNLSMIGGSSASFQDYYCSEF